MTLDEIVEEFLDHYRHGKEPSVDEYATRFSEFANELRATLPALALMQKFGPNSAESSGRRVDADPSLRQIGDYRLLAQIGRGGMGVVYEAEQESLGAALRLRCCRSACCMTRDR